MERRIYYLPQLLEEALPSRLSWVVEFLDLEYANVPMHSLPKFSFLLSEHVDRKKDYLKARLTWRQSRRTNRARSSLISKTSAKLKFLKHLPNSNTNSQPILHKASFFKRALSARPFLLQARCFERATFFNGAHWIDCGESRVESSAVEGGGSAPKHWTLSWKRALDYLLSLYYELRAIWLLQQARQAFPRSGIKIWYFRSTVDLLSLLLTIIPLFFLDHK